MSTTPNGVCVSRQRATISRYRSSKMWSGSATPGNRTVCRGKSGISIEPGFETGRRPDVLARRRRQSMSRRRDGPSPLRRRQACPAPPGRAPLRDPCRRLARSSSSRRSREAVPPGVPRARGAGCGRPARTGSPWRGAPPAGRRPPRPRRRSGGARVSPRPMISRASTPPSPCAGELGDERAVDLQDVGRQALEVAERRVAGPEVVDRDADAHRAQRVRGSPSRRSPSSTRIDSVTSRMRPLGGSPAAARAARDVVEQARIGQLPGAEVDAHREVGDRRSPRQRDRLR